MKIAFLLLPFVMIAVGAGCGYRMSADMPPISGKSLPVALRGVKDMSSEADSGPKLAALLRRRIDENAPARAAIEVKITDIVWQEPLPSVSDQGAVAAGGSATVFAEVKLVPKGGGAAEVFEVSAGDNFLHGLGTISEYEVRRDALDRALTTLADRIALAVARRIAAMDGGPTSAADGADDEALKQQLIRHARGFHLFVGLFQHHG